jgi:hypothetical protein
VRVRSEFHIVIDSLTTLCRAAWKPAGRRDTRSLVHLAVVSRPRCSSAWSSPTLCGVGASCSCARTCLGWTSAGARRTPSPSSPRTATSGSVGPECTACPNSSSRRLLRGISRWLLAAPRRCSTSLGAWAWPATRHGRARTREVSERSSGRQLTAHGFAKAPPRKQRKAEAAEGVSSPTHGQLPAAQGSPTTVSRSDIRLIQYLYSSAGGLVRRWLLIGFFPIHLLPTTAQLSAAQGNLTSCLNFDFAILNYV